MPPKAITHYRIIRSVGAGGMGQVFLAEDTILGRKVAIKMLSEQWIGSEHARQRLINEAKAAAALDHPNICAIHEVGEEDGHVFIVMPYIEGQSLAERIWQHPLSPAEVVDIGIQAAEALEAAHGAGIIHRDVKPHNIIITPRNQVKVLDFGLAKITQPDTAESSDAPTIDRLTEVGSVLGTPGYMSPEQAYGSRLDARSDVFSLGVTLHECATGTQVFGGSSPLAVALRVVTETPAAPSASNPAVPPALDRIIARAMAKDPVARYESAAALLSDLRELRREMEGRQGSSQPLPVMASAVNPRWRSMRSVASIAAAVVVLLLGAWWLSGLFRSGRHVPLPEAAIWYDRGTNAIREGAYLQATRALERALELDDGFALARARMAEAYAEIELGDRAKLELVQAMTLLPDRSSLSDAESTYLDAVAATLSRDFETAIEKYARISDSARNEDKAAAFVDLGRAYEKDNDLARAIEAYQKATQLDPQSAAAFLRAGTLYGRRQQLAEASDAFSQAENIYRAMSNQEGLAEVYYQRGASLARIRRLPEAKEQLERSLELSRSSANDFQTIRSELQLSNVYYAVGDSARAKTTATDAVKAAQTVNMRTLATNGLIDLGYTLLARGEFADTRTYLEQALTLARQDQMPRLEARARLALGSLSTQESRFDDAVSHLEAALKFFQPAGYRIETSNALILLGRANRDKGEYSVAMKAFSEQLELATQSGDTARMAATELSLGILVGRHQEMYPEALSHFEESYRVNSANGARIGMVDNQIGRADALWVLGRYGEASAALDEAYTMASGPDAGFKSSLAEIESTRAQLALSQGKTVEATRRATAALALADGEYEETALQARQTLALAHVASGTSKQALALAEQSVATARNLKLPRLVSRALLVSAEVRLAGGDARGSLADAQEAQRMCAAAAQLESEWRAWLLSARAVLLADNISTAYDHAARAESARAALQARWGDSYAGYAQRPDIQVRSKRLVQLLGAKPSGPRRGG